MPPPDDDLSRLRLMVGKLRERESRRLFDTTVYVGQLEGPRDSFVVRAQDLPIMDVGMRIEVVASLVAQTSGDCTLAWLTRAGSPHTSDADLQWLAAADMAFAISGRPLEAFYAVTRSGWLNVRTGKNREWRRLRL